MRIVTLPVRELCGVVVHSDNSFVPGDLVSINVSNTNFGHYLNSAAAFSGAPKARITPGFGMIISLYKDEYIPDGKELGLVAVVVWAEVPRADDTPWEFTPYITDF